MRRFLVAVVLAVSALPAAAQDPRSPQRPIDWNALQTESVQVLRDYIRVNTTNPPGNELDAARFLKTVLDREGIEATILDTAELGGNHANL